MAPSPLRPKTILKHARCSSFPSSSHPIVSQFNEHLSRVKSSSEATSSTLSTDLGYLKLLDVCAIIKDLLSNEKQNKQGLLSALGRRRNMNMDDISIYQTSRKKSKKMIQKLLKDLKSRMKENVEKYLKHWQLKEVQLVTLGLFKSLLSYTNRNGSQSSNWSLLSKKKEEVESSNVDAALWSKTGKYDELQNQLLNVFSGV
ncbi:hypothetical protein H5410_009932 [Solanum commersonii]|uniref:Uncharacterized protein n=1 Tax=Solanum commersonii TaxID=4109 RepID=A0A9J6AKW4_SOLCO|nr:hypothetical protein H5410_009932 [Solanum commersonii]